MSWKISLKDYQIKKTTDITVLRPFKRSFPIVAAIITPDSQIKVNNICVNKLRMGLFKTLIEMGAHIELTNEREMGVK